MIDTEKPRLTNLEELDTVPEWLQKAMEYHRQLISQTDPHEKYQSSLKQVFNKS